MKVKAFTQSSWLLKTSVFVREKAPTVSIHMFQSTKSKQLKGDKWDRGWRKWLEQPRWELVVALKSVQQWLWHRKGQSWLPWKVKWLSICSPTISLLVIFLIITHAEIVFQGILFAFKAHAQLGQPVLFQPSMIFGDKIWAFCKTFMGS